MRNPSNLLLITGAGASYDVVDTEIMPVKIEYRPPLTRNLFYPSPPIIAIKLHDGRTATNESHYVNDCLEDYPVAQKIGYDFRLTSNTGEEEKNLEDYLNGIKSDAKILRKNQFWSIPIYLYTLFNNMSKYYIPSGNSMPMSTNYQILIEKINNSSYKQLIWLNLNYDLFADFAIRCSVAEDLSTMSNYLNLTIKGGIKIKYTKPHGSVDWFKRLNSSDWPENINWNTIIRFPNRLPNDFEERLSKQTYTEFEYSNLGVDGTKFPALTAPIGRNYDFVCTEHKSGIEDELKNTTDILCIGFSALDMDILNMMKDNLPEISRLKIVNGSRDLGERAYANMAKHLRAFPLNELGIPKKEAVSSYGFTDFIKIEIDRWLR